MKHILVTGCKGQLGNEIQLLASKYDDTCEFYFTDKDELDITDRKAVYAFIASLFAFLFAFSVCGSCGRAFPRWLMGLFRYLDFLSPLMIETNSSFVSVS